MANAAKTVGRRSSMDMTEGNIIKLIIVFALPILAGQIFQNLYNSVDAIVVGRYVGTTALAAVSASSDISHLLVGFFTGLSTGCGVLLSRYFGAKNYERLHDAIHTALCFALIVGFCMAALGIVATPLLLRIVDCPADVYAEASSYLRIYLAGILFTAIYNVGSGILRAVGDSRHPFYYLVISSIVNIILDLVFVIWLQMGVMGVALATIISQLTSVTLVFLQLTRTQDVYKVILRHLKLDRELVSEVIDLGLPAAIQASIISISNLFVQRYINGFGSSAMAGIGAAKKIDKFVGLIAQSIGQSATTFVSQNYGAKRLDRAFKSLGICMLINFTMIAIIGTPIYYMAEKAVSIFTTDPDSIAYGVGMIHTMMPFYFIQSLNALFANATRGFGKSKIVMFCSVFGMVVCRQIFLAITMHLNYDVVNVYRGYPFGWACAAFSVMTYFYFAIWRKHRHELKKSA
ncbi:MAG: MATE family efflux transporter [Clostridia bacterium]|nr:MATE family efflux transporter [Clostridia bacterium]